MNKRQKEGVISKRFYKLLDTLSIQSQVFQSSLWNTISPQRIKNSIESHSKSANSGHGFPRDSDGQPDKQVHRVREARTGHNIHNRKQGLLQKDRNSGDVTANDRPQQPHRDSNTKKTAPVDLITQRTSISSSIAGCPHSSPYSGSKCLKAKLKLVKTYEIINL